VFGEYNYTNFGRNDVAFTAAPGTVGAADVVSTRVIVQQAAAGVNYKFNWGGPVVAKY
jgi:outer membrane immunogenic protein